MADCDTPTLSVPVLTCAADLPNWATQLVASMQAAINQAIGCIQDFEYPECDICVLKDDLVNCPLDVDMIDFTDIAWADDGGIGVMPYPTQAGLDFRYGTGTWVNVTDGWVSVAIVFDTPFANEAYGITIQPQLYSEGTGFYQTYNSHVTALTVNGATVWIIMAEADEDRDLPFYYLAWGT